MLIKQSVFIIFTLVITLAVFTLFDFGYILSYIITLSIVLVSYIIYANITQRKRYNLIENELDPETFIKATEKQFETIKNNKRSDAMLSNDLAVGLISIGRFNEAKSILEKINIKDVPKRGGIFLSYLNNIMIANYKVNNIDEADKIYEDYIRKYKVKRDRERKIIDLILANKSLVEKDYSRSHKLFMKVLEKNESQRLKIEIEFSLAKIEEGKGNIREAINKYQYVLDNGGKLYSVSLAREKLQALKEV